MSKKRPYKKNISSSKTVGDPQTNYTPKKKLIFEAHHTFEEMDAAKRAAFMRLSMAERFKKGLELYQMFKERNKKKTDPDSFVLRKRK